MLEELRIRNFAIIDALEVHFTRGLNIITGETGAGKSIMINAVNLILGDRASADLIRSSEDSATVEALFTVSGNPELAKRLAAAGIDDAEDLIIRRTLSKSGKNRIHVNGQTATLAVLASLGEALINICGQHEHQVLLDADRHIDILDEFGGLMRARSEFREQYDVCLALQTKLQTLKGVADDKARSEDYLRFQLREIDEIAPTAGEDAALADEKKVLRNAVGLRERAERCYERLYEREGSIIAELGQVLRDVQEIRQIDTGMALAPDDLEAVRVTLDETALVLRDYLGRIHADPLRLDEIEERLERLGKLKRKYGGVLEEVLARREVLARELDGLASVDEEMTRLAAEIAQRTERLRDEALVLSANRREKARELKEAVEREIRELKMEHARFEVVFREKSAARPDQPLDAFNAKGMDEIEFYLSPNAGEDLKPLNRIASGGELSRIVLGLKKVLAGVGSVGTIVFDEVDSGIGGAVAEIVGEKLRDVARSHQVICITHLPQIACFGDSHYVVSKRIEGERTTTGIARLADEERADEIARMLGGIDITEKTRAHAREMLEEKASPHD